ncbi:hypothetical protein Pmani_027830 [Petrolisthes manimaculis]|uniref:Uncharacterized protein n=1 Tax=Petrolisthes manimaculis TaxID=1843537 RepID=A0AAE1P3C4_9EUCA|nr:hypothetical protein Pmani_027830 [Petrolisthes manimaculis]
MSEESASECLLPLQELKEKLISHDHPKLKQIKREKHVKFVYQTFDHGMEKHPLNTTPDDDDEEENATQKKTRENAFEHTHFRGNHDLLEKRASIKRLEFKRSRTYRRSLQFIDDTPDSQVDEDPTNLSPQSVGKLVSGAPKLKEKEDSREEEREVSAAGIYNVMERKRWR